MPFSRRKAAYILDANDLYPAWAEFGFFMQIMQNDVSAVAQLA